MVGQPFEQGRLQGSIPRAAERAPAQGATVSPAAWLRRGATAVILAALIGFAATLGAAFAFDDHPTGCAAPDGSAGCCPMQAQDEFATRLCDDTGG